jgi:hypothetical protein
VIAIGHHPVTTLFDLIAIRLGGNESARRYQPHLSPEPGEWRLQRGLNPSKICLMSHNADVVQGTPHIATPRLADSRSLATLKSP